MTRRWKTIHPRVKGLLHGGDYNPDQWLDSPDVIDEDFRLMELAHANTFSVNIFGWSAIEPKEGVYRLEWLDRIMDRIAERGGHAILATPSGARPAWLSEKYPEVLRVGANRVRNLHGQRHNHCYTSPVYREKTAQLNRMLAERYKDHPALILWHVSNEYGGECHCDLCQEAFRNWLKQQYDHDLAKLNHAWWTGFWSHTFSEWSQIESPAPHGEDQVHGLNLDWKRFVTSQTIDFYNNEVKPLKEITPDIEVTTNFMGSYPLMKPDTGLNYEEFAKAVDVVSWDSYPAWHNDWQSTASLAKDVAFVNDLYRSLKDGRPFLIMESTPSQVNWHEINKAKRAGMHKLSAVQSIAHGSDSILYFQWRKSRGSSEKFHGAVIDHVGHEHTRVFADVAEVGDLLGKLPEISGTTVKAEVAIMFDWETEWALADAQGFGKNKKYIDTCQEHYRVFWEAGIPVDVITPDKPVNTYKLVIAPMLYMVREGFAEKMERYVEQGGTFVTTYMSGIVDRYDLVFREGFPGPLKPLLGIWAEEVDSLYPKEVRHFVTSEGVRYRSHDYCELIHAVDAEVLARFDSDFYEGQPAVTVNRRGAGQAYYIASRNEARFHDDFYARLMKELNMAPPHAIQFPKGVSVQARTDGETDYIFVMNFTEERQTVQLDQDYRNLESGHPIRGQVELQPYGVLILKPIS
ncbi:beta-galactosidase GanA [Paenibacillus antibioticophila]|uniref:Beta-galactosidase n=1 Tax=Paenibacillus antibioticophila TaxID=1274374 RepID=A0A920CE71_9BACL|nr:beta-galactosidase [Paenibacillus antibioticophila]GIO36641.1 beta-galactosidase GanA [Paenibacillus antibioticophila]